jgi:pimeloyl-ACP methyl ester carboxylesterase
MAVGHSMGARVCIPFAVRLGLRCRGLVIEDMDVRPRRARSEILNPAELRRIKDFKYVRTSGQSLAVAAATRETRCAHANRRT